MIKATYDGYYYKQAEMQAGVVVKPARPIFRYLLSGSKEELERYEQVLVSGSIPVRKNEDGKIFFFSASPSGKVLTIGFSENPETGVTKIITQDDEMAGLTALMQLETDPGVKEHFSSQMAQTKLRRVGEMMGRNFLVNSAPVQPSAGATDDAKIEADVADLEQG